MWAVSLSPKWYKVFLHFIHLYVFLSSFFLHKCVTDRKNSLHFKTNNREDLLKLYKVMAVPVLLYICRNCRLMKRLERRIEIMEIKVLRSVAGCKLHSTIKQNKKGTKYVQFK